ncbi:MAG TPA: hypothetical protein VGW38_12055, partial [Chloroflexota bacterium]|nr:hypothetical protein [Chloroflexota bacterium]
TPLCGDLSAGTSPIPVNFESALQFAGAAKGRSRILACPSADYRAGTRRSAFSSVGARHPSGIQAANARRGGK